MSVAVKMKIATITTTLTFTWTSRHLSRFQLNILVFNKPLRVFATTTATITGRNAEMLQ